MMNLNDFLQETWARNAATVTVELMLVGLIFLSLNFGLGRGIGILISARRLKWLHHSIEMVRDNLRGALLFAAAIAIGLTVALNAWWWYHGLDLYSSTRARFEAIPAQFWGEIGFGSAKVSVLVVAAAYVVRMLKRLLPVLSIRVQNMDSIRANDEAVQNFFGLLERILTRATWIGILVLSSVLLHFPSTVQNIFKAALWIYLIIGAGLLLWRALDALIASFEALSKQLAGQRNLLSYYERLANIMPLFRHSVEYVLYIGVATLVVRQIEAIADLAEWGPRLISVVGVVFLARVANELAQLFLNELLIVRASLDSVQSRSRHATLAPLMRSTAEYTIYFWAGIIILQQLSIDPTPILAGAGILALAVGLGAQNLVNDVVSGFFCLFENHYSVGDTVEINDVEGAVEAIELRVTRLRDDAGRVHIIRNGQINTLVNYSKEYVMSVVDVVVPHEANIKAVFEVLQGIAHRARDEIADVLAATEIWGLVEFGESGITVRTITRVRPGCHDTVGCELRLLIKEAFEEAGIEMPYPRRVLIVQNQPPVTQPG